jgi:hypothetical protein
MTREIGENAEQAYIRDQEYYRKLVIHREIIEAGVKARERCAKFKDAAWRQVEGGKMDENQIHALSYRWYDTRLRVMAAQKRAQQAGTELTILESREETWVQFNTPTNLQLQRALREMDRDLVSEFGYEKEEDGQ